MFVPSYLSVFMACTAFFTSFFSFARRLSSLSMHSSQKERNIIGMSISIRETVFEDKMYSVNVFFPS